MNRFVKVISPAKVHPEEVAVKEIQVGNSSEVCNQV